MTTKIELTRSTLLAVRVTEAFLVYLGEQAPEAHYLLGNDHLHIERTGGTDEAQVIKTRIGGRHGWVAMTITIMAEPTTAQCLFTADVGAAKPSRWRGLAEESTRGVTITHVSDLGSRLTPVA